MSADHKLWVQHMFSIANRSEGDWWHLSLSDKEQPPHQKMGMAKQRSIDMQTQYTASLSKNTILEHNLGASWIQKKFL